jgi:hypothetical protein
MFSLLTAEYTLVVFIVSYISTQLKLVALSMRAVADDVNTLPSVLREHQGILKYASSLITF